MRHAKEQEGWKWKEKQNFPVEDQYIYNKKKYISLLSCEAYDKLSWII